MDIPLDRQQAGHGQEVDPDKVDRYMQMSDAFSEWSEADRSEGGSVESYQDAQVGFEQAWYQRQDEVDELQATIAQQAEELERLWKTLRGWYDYGYDRSECERLLTAEGEQDG